MCLLLWFNGKAVAQQKVLSASDWIAEDQSGAFKLIQRADTLELIVPSGLTLWYNHRFTGDYEITYRVCVVMRGGSFDRLSDLNCFWGANDPLHSDHLLARSSWRKGIFQHYNSLNLFYVGYGGNQNTTTRFRRYHGEYYGVDENRIKPLLGEYTDANHLLRGNEWYQIQIKVKGDQTTYSVNGERLFSSSLNRGQGDGYFALRLLENHVLLTDFKYTIH